MIFKNNKTYDILKYISTIGVPALVTLIITVGDIWNLSYSVPIAATLSAIGIFITSLLQISSNQFKKGDDENE